MKQNNDGVMPITSHLLELRKRLVVIFLTVGYYNYNMSSTCRKLSCMNNPVCDEEEMKRQKFDAILEGKRIRKDDVTNRDYWVNQSIKHYECMMFFNTGIARKNRHTLNRSVKCTTKYMSVCCWLT